MKSQLFPLYLAGINPNTLIGIVSKTVNCEDLRSNLGNFRMVFKFVNSFKLFPGKYIHNRIHVNHFRLVILS